MVQLREAEFVQEVSPSRLPRCRKKQCIPPGPLESSWVYQVCLAENRNISKEKQYEKATAQAFSVLVQDVYICALAERARREGYRPDTERVLEEEYAARDNIQQMGRRGIEFLFQKNKSKNSTKEEATQVRDLKKFAKTICAKK